MAWAFRAGASKLRTRIGLCKIASTNNVPKVQVSWISTRQTRKTRPPRPEPFPYKEKSFNIWEQIFDDTVFRFDDNTKVILVEGPPAVGKGELAKKLAHDLDMLYVPQTVLEDEWVHKYNFDLRTLDDKLPESCRSVDLSTFLNNPSLRNGGVMQLFFYRLRFHKYMKILAHVLSTGQGVVTERSPWSDDCFAKAMHANGYLSPNAFKLYNTMVEQSLHELMRPHLVVYLDASVKDVQEKIKKRNIPGESKIFNEKFLTDLENNYKYDFLKKMDEHANILIYDYSRGGDFEVIVEDIETLKFDEQPQDSKKMMDWDLVANVMWTERRRKYSDQQEQMLLYLMLQQLIADELIVTAEESYIRHEVLKKYAPRDAWDPNYMPLKPKKNLLEAAQ
ncbi:NADH dehydrogenase [ubiquinone] 1 alpha subcomplex subunit 10, mitochondrial [Belonocnema kinseyi]|uniref:NADH dehydrogenase [ubiquinone] 1 alpha subcomplex subunit 10, mitochondrial n=1 Tax=Belonocnema kinseyi TaxID=2817044 RepID=UPI00143D6C8E|nr:NADH dehydrogenase [ubiquinone] 1 alpha subcomplex subunit 10, mitochondrial [Belonocnema kinseyi]